MQGDLLALASVNIDGVFPWSADELVGDREHRVEALLPGDVEVGLDLWCVEVVAAGLDLNLAMTAAIWHHDKIGTQIKRSLIAYDH